MADAHTVEIAAATFVGFHFILSHPLRRPLVRAIGEATFLGLYSLIAFLTLGWMVWAYLHAPATAPLWEVGDGLWAFVTLVMLVAAMLLMGSLIGNPALPNPTGSNEPPAEADGVFAITRHPMMWSFALWGFCHILVFPIAKNIAVAVAIIFLALVGAALQDRKKAGLDPEGWPAWEARTSYWPLIAIATGRARIRRIGMHTIAGGLAVWLAATWVHIPLAGWPAGIWRWVLG
jgi:uncharacterized membrane protein